MWGTPKTQFGNPEIVLSCSGGRMGIVSELGEKQDRPDPRALRDRRSTAFRESERPPRPLRHRATRTCVRGLLPKTAGPLAAAPPYPLPPSDGMEEVGMERDGLRPPRTRTTPDS